MLEILVSVVTTKSVPESDFATRCFDSDVGERCRESFRTERTGSPWTLMRQMQVGAPLSGSAWHGCCSTEERTHIILFMKFYGLTFAACAFAACLACNGGCSKDTITIDCSSQYATSSSGSSDDSGGSDSSGDEGAATNLVGFHATVESLNMTRSMSPIAADTRVTIYAFHGATNDATTTAPMARGSYVAQAAGMLSGTNGYKMYLSNGVFDFYAVSINSNVSPPTFSNGVSGPLSNGVDYLWWKCTDYDINASQVTVPIVLNHSATQVVVEVSAGTGVVLQQIVSATISQPQTGAVMNLADGVISPATSYASQPASMGVNGLRAQYIMLPLETDTPMTLTLSLNVNYDPTPRTYTVQVPVPDGALAAGNSYLFSAIIDANTVTFPNVGVTDWTPVDETGNPLYPH